MRATMSHWRFHAQLKADFIAMLSISISIERRKWIHLDEHFLHRVKDRPDKRKPKQDRFTSLVSPAVLALFGNTLSQVAIDDFLFSFGELPPILGLILWKDETNMLFGSRLALFLLFLCIFAVSHSTSLSWKLSLELVYIL